MLRSESWVYRDAYIPVKATRSVENTPARGQANNSANKEVVFKTCAAFTNCISRINNTQADDPSYIVVVMPMCKLIEYSDNYLKTSVILWQYYRDASVLNAAGDAIAEVTEAHSTTTKSFQIKEKITDQADNSGAKNVENVEITVPLKYLGNIWRTLQIPLINFEITLDLNWSRKSVIAGTIVANQGTKFSITDIKLYVPVVRERRDFVGSMKYFRHI